MEHHPSTRASFGPLLAFVGMILGVALALVPATPAEAACSPLDPSGAGTLDVDTSGCRVGAGRIVHPIAGGSTVESIFGAPRPDDRLHKGIDLGRPKLWPVVAVADGTVMWILDGEACCAVALRHADGWSSWYVHLNNDTFGTDDGLGTGLAPWVAEGVHVRAGQVLGWLGDSGNAETAIPHVHFELRTPWGEPIDPLAIVRRAVRVPGPAAGAYIDDDGDPDEPLFDTLTSIGLFAPCDPTVGLLACPDARLTLHQATATLARLGIAVPRLDGLPAPLDGYAADDDDPDPLAECFEDVLCRISPLTIDQAERLLDRIRAAGVASTVDAPTIGAAGSCTPSPPTATRRWWARQVAQALGLTPTVPCDRLD